MLRQPLQVPQTNLAGADRLYRSSLITETIVSCGHICTLSSPTGLWYSDRRSGHDRCSASLYKCLRQTWQVLIGFTGPHLSQRQLCPADTFVLSAVLLVFGTLTGTPDMIGAPPAFTSASDKPGADRLYRSSLITETTVSCGHICTLSSPTGLWTKKVLQTRQELRQALHLPCSRQTFILVSIYLETMPEPLNHIASP